MELFRISDIHPHVYRGKDENGFDIIVKYRKHGNGFISNFILKQSFKNEVRLLIKLDEHDTKNFSTPKILKTDFNTFMIQTIMNGSYLKCTKLINTDNIAKGLYEFHTFEDKYNTSFFWKIFQRFFMSVGASIHRGSIKLAIKRQKPLYAFFAILVFYKSALRSFNQSNYLLHHRDLINHDNSFVLKYDRLGLIDFGSSRKERKWIFMDLIDLSVDYNLNVNTNLLFSCVEKIKMLADKKISLKDQIRISLLRRLLHPARLHGSDCEHFLLNVLLDEKNFEEWYRENIEDRAPKEQIE